MVGFDFGTRKIGVAAGQALTGSATPLEALARTQQKPDWERIRSILDEWHPDIVVVGLPLNMDGTESELSRRARRFARQLEGRFGTESRMIDERLSTREARERLGPAARKGPDPRVDSVAAVLIIEAFFAGAAGERPEAVEQPDD